MNSKIEYVGFGVVVEDKPEMVDLIKVYLKDVIQVLDSDINNPLDVKGKLTVDNTKEVEFNGKIDNTIEAKWIPLYSGNNRITAPDVRIGQTVLIYKTINSIKYYWTTMLKEIDLSTRENIIHMFSSKNEQTPGVVNNEDNVICIVNTVDKFINLTTPKNDNEPSKLILDINYKDGVIIIRDDKKNSITFDSAKDELVLELDKNIKTTTGENFNIKNGKNISVDNGADLTVTNKGNLTINNSKDTTYTNGGNITINGKGDVVLNVTGKFNVIKGGKELLDVISKGLGKIKDAMTIGNLGVPAPLDPGDKTKIKDTMDEIDNFRT